MNNELERTWTEAVMNTFTAPSLNLPGQIRKTLRASIITVYGPGQHDDSINIQIVYTATIQDFMRIVTTNEFSPFYYKQDTLI
jgi:hypothetical protein